MRISASLHGQLENAAAEAARARDLGFDAVSTAEVAHDPFVPLALAAAESGSMTLETHIAVAFARSPMQMASVAHDLHALSGGRLVLGLGTQTKPHILRRFQMPWSGRPVLQMRDYVGALRAIWADWDRGEPLRFRSQHYSHTLMTDTFRPAPLDTPPPAIHLAAVGPVMTRLAGEVCDGLVPHAFSTPEWFREVTLPALMTGVERAGRERADLVVHCPGFVLVTDASGPSPDQLQALRQQIAFYGSTPAYADVLRLHGWDSVHDGLHRLSLGDDPERWVRMADLVTDEMVTAFAVVGPLARVVTEIAARYGDDIDQVNLSSAGSVTADDVRQARAALAVPAQT
jgi:probable F420-dependent oxidoreductase